MLYGIPLLIFTLYTSLLFFEAPMKQGVLVGIILFLAGILALWYTQNMKSKIDSKIIKKIILLSIATQIGLTFITFGHSDIFRYLWDGKVLLAGFNPYSLTPDVLSQAQAISLPWYWDYLFFKWSGTSYPPLLQIIFAISNIISLDSLITLKLIFVAFNAGTLTLLYHLVPNDKIHWLAFVALGPLFVYDTIGTGHSEAIFMFLLVLSLWLYKHNKNIALGTTLTGLILVKFIPILIVPFFIKKKNWLLVSLSALVSLIMITAPFARQFPLWQLTMPLILYSKEWLMSPGLFSLINHFIDNSSLTKYLFLAVELLLLFKLWYNNKFSVETKSAIIFLWLLISSAAVFSWYWLWVLPLLPFVTTRVRNIALAGIIMFPLQFIIMYFDTIDNTIKYTNNGLIWWHQLLLWLPLTLTIFYYYIYQDKIINTKTNTNKIHKANT